MSNDPSPQPGSAPGKGRRDEAPPGGASGGGAATSPDRPQDKKQDKKSDKKQDKKNDPLRRSRAGGFYVGVIVLGLVLILLIIFVLQNTEPTTVRFLPWEAEIPVAVALLIAAAAGLFLAGMAASMRILQLRSRVKHDRKAG